MGRRGSIRTPALRTDRTATVPGAAGRAMAPSLDRGRGAAADPAVVLEAAAVETTVGAAVLGGATGVFRPPGLFGGLGAAIGLATGRAGAGGGGGAVVVSGLA